MSPESLIPIFVLFCLAGGVIYLLLRFTKTDIPMGRFPSIDGLRGILAFSVFLHHSMTWFYFLRINEWALPYSVYTHFGPSSVAMFFMITAFLFYSKLLDAKEKGIDWTRLYVSRFYRIMPLYGFAILVLFIVAGFVSHFTLRVNALLLVIEFFQWLCFIETDINNITGTHIIIAGVVWSLAFEWLFYCSLAWVGKVIFRIRTPINILISTGLLFVVFLLIILYSYPNGTGIRIYPFAGGITAAFLARNNLIRKYCSSAWASCLLLILIPGILLLYPDVATPVPFIGICLAFITIAAGNDIFGLLSHRLTRYLGMISYSLYLLHGLVLFSCFYFVLGFKRAKALSPLEHWLIIGGCSVLLILLCSLTYVYIERPAQRKNANAASELKKAIV